MKDIGYESIARTVCSP